APGEFERRWSEYALDFRGFTGFALPGFNVQSSSDLEAGGYRVSFNGVTIVSAFAPLDCIFLEINPSLSEILGLSVVAESRHPVSGGACFWTHNTLANRASCEAAGFRVYDFLDVLALRLGTYFRRNPELLLSVSEIYSRLKEIESNQPGFLSDLLEGGFMNVSRVSEVMQQLIREGVNVKRFPNVLEALGAYSATYGSQLSKEGEFDLSDVVSYVRLSQRKQILGSVLTARRTIRGCFLSDQVQEIFSSFFLEAPTSSPKLSTRDFERLRVGFESSLQSIKQRGVLPVAVICPSEIRSQVSWFLRQVQGEMPLICREELEPMIEIEPLAAWSV
ncbi:MAG: FHIPEP family type III secretion protein, partial [Bdellovibrionales bacterium]|nr:FHIPEP family type III secretion protein [Bdellovibrionales bacterium]